MSAVEHIDDYKTGLFYSEEFRGQMSWNGYERSNLLRNEGCDSADGTKTPRFTDVAMALGADDGKDARGFAIADFDNDGDLDIAVNNNPGDNGDAERAAAVLLRNDIGSSRNWLVVDLVGTASNRDAVGAEVRVRAADLRLMRQVTAGSGYASQHSRRLHFGLDDQTTIDRLEVRWPSGTTETFADLAARQQVRIVEGRGVVPAEANGATGHGRR